MEKITLSIPGINCNHCVMAVKREGNLVPGVEFVSGDAQAKTATFAVADQASLASLKRALADAGYAPA